MASLPQVTIHVDLPLEATRWVAVWGERWEREAYFDDQALAVAYAAAHRGQVVRMAALDPWPRVGDFLPSAAQSPPSVP